jgi:hypothetical protein
MVLQTGKYSKFRLTFCSPKPGLVSTKFDVNGTGDQTLVKIDQISSINPDSISGKNNGHPRLPFPYQYHPRVEGKPATVNQWPGGNFLSGWFISAIH